MFAIKMRRNIFVIFVIVFTVAIVSGDTNENLKSLLGDNQESTTTLQKNSNNQDENNHADIKEENKKKTPISVVAIDDDGKSTDAVLKSPDNATLNGEPVDKDSNQSEKNDAEKKKEEEETNVKNETETIEEAFLPAEGAAEKEHSSSLAIFFVLFVLVLCIFLIHFILQNKCHYIPESLAIVFLGGFVGAVIKLLPNEELSKVESFSPTTFFLVLLPPIIFESGYNLHKGNFFANLGKF